MGSVLDIIIFIIILGIIILVHEVGHLLFAKLFGVYCHEFSIGMGPLIYSKKFGETKYSLRAIPIGGYVAMAGEDDDEEGIPDDRKLNHKPKYQYILILFAGAFFNFILGFILLLGLGFSNGVPKDGSQVNIVNDSNIDTVAMYDTVNIVEINGTLVGDYDDISREILAAKSAGNIEVIFEDEGVEKSYVNSNIDSEFTLGVQPLMTKNFAAVISETGNRFVDVSTAVGKSFGRLITKFTSTVNQVSGPVGIYQVVSESREIGFASLVLVTAFLSINIGILNLIPIPALDGSKILIAICEKITGKNLPIRIQYIVSATGLLILLGFTVFITVKDIIRLGG